jgi:hypothetical protein
MFHGFLVYEEKVVKCLTWWKEHASKFPNAFLFARQNLNVLRFQIKVKNLQRCHLKTTNIDVLVMTFKITNSFSSLNISCFF